MLLRSGFSLLNQQSVSQVPLPPPAPTAYFLVAHGSRDPRSQLALEQVVSRVREQIAPTLVEGGTLEFHPLPLAAQLVKFARLAAELGYVQVRVLPLFLLLGNHVRADLPTALAAACDELRSSFTLNSIAMTLLPHLGSHPQLVSVLRQHLTAASGLGINDWIFLAHGSRRTEANRAIQELAAQLRATPAFWAAPPGLEVVISQIVQRQIQQVGVVPRIGIFPYFLFPGTLLDGMIQQISQLQQQLQTGYPRLDLVSIPPLDPLTTLVELIVGLLLEGHPRACLVTQLHSIAKFWQT